MPRIAASVLWLVLVIAALWWNIASHPVVWQMLAPKEDGQKSAVSAVVVEQPKPQSDSNAAQQPKAARAHVSTGQAEPEKPQTPVLAFSADASLQPTAELNMAVKQKPSEGALPDGRFTTDVVTENSERRYPPEPFMAEAAAPTPSADCKNGCPVRPQLDGIGAAAATVRAAGGPPLQWLPPNKQQSGLVSPSDEQAAQSHATPSGTSLPAVVASFGRMAQEAFGPVPIQPDSHPGTLVPVSRESEDSETSAFQVRRLPPIEDEKQPTVLATAAPSEIPTTYPSTGLE